MVLLDVNVLVYAHREDTLDHARYLEYLTALAESQGPFGVSELVLSGFLRVVTHPKVFTKPTPLSQAVHRRIARATELRRACAGVPSLGAIHRVVSRSRCKGESDTARVPRGTGDRKRKRVDHHRPRYWTIPKSALETPTRDLINDLRRWGLPEPESVELLGEPRIHWQRCVGNQRF
jgi:predicted nucleic acid-binding protein